MTEEGRVMETTALGDLDQAEQGPPRLSLQVAKPLVVLGEKFA